ncbi:peroxidase-related enzyme [Halovenus sp. HT40]|uniref:peroxidase-related enzyme n=1 Tax=Halovenus sp. HT40 TaxID=3126691 RepID=UPI00300EE6F5
MADSEPAMTRFPVPDLEDMPEDIREHIEEETERAGFMPNVMQAFAYRPHQYRAFFDYHDALVDHSPLAREEIEMIIVTVSGANDCLYCVVAHGAMLRIYGEDPHLAEQLATNHRTADISDAHTAMCDVAVKLTESPAEVGESDLERLREHGFSEKEIWDIGSLTALFNLSNRMASFADMRPNEEFYTLGRE